MLYIFILPLCVVRLHIAVCISNNLFDAKSVLSYSTHLSSRIFNTPRKKADSFSSNLPFRQHKLL